MLTNTVTATAAASSGMAEGPPRCRISNAMVTAVSPPPPLVFCCCHTGFCHRRYCPPLYGWPPSRHHGGVVSQTPHVLDMVGIPGNDSQQAAHLAPARLSAKSHYRVGKKEERGEGREAVERKAASNWLRPLRLLGATPHAQ